MDTILTTSEVAGATVQGSEAQFRIHALSAEVLAQLRSGGADASGSPAQQVVAGGGEPVRCCLRNAEAGESLLLFGYAPPLPASPYREMGAVYVHAFDCGGLSAADAHRYPAAWVGRPQVLRAYDARGWIHEATRVHDGTAPEAAIAEVLAAPGVVQVHSRNVAYGCYMFTVVRH